MKIMNQLIAVLVAVVLVVTVAIPIIDNSASTIGKKTEIVLENPGTPIIKGETGDEYNVQWDSNLPAVIKVNGDVTTVYFNKIYESATVSPSSKEVTVDLTYGELPTPTCDGYTFDGWFTSTEYTTEVTETTIVVGTEDKILYAKWIANEYTVTFDADGGTVSPATKTVTFGQEYGELPTPTYTGHIFGGWFDSDNNPITSDVVVRTAENHTLTAVWTLENYLISFTVNDNTMGTVNPTEIYADYGDSYTVSGNTITFGATTVTASAISPNVFGEWTVSGTTAVSGTVTGAMTFVATFDNPPVTLYFTTDGTTGATVSTASYSDVPRGTEYVVADNTVTVTGFGTVTASLVNGYYFTGWSVAQGIGTVSAETTFEAQYELIQIAKVIANGSSSRYVVLTTDGKLFDTKDNSTFTQLLENEDISDIKADYNTFAVLTTDGKFYATILSNITSSNFVFTQFLSGENISTFDCSQNTLIYVTTSDGKFFLSNSNPIIFNQYLNSEGISKVSIQSNSCSVVTTDGKLFAHYGSSVNFTQYLSSETFVDTITNNGLYIALTNDGKLYRTTSQGNISFTQFLNGENVSKLISTNAVLTTDGKLFTSSGSGSSTTFSQKLSEVTITNASYMSQILSVYTENDGIYICNFNASTSVKFFANQTIVSSFFTDNWAVVMDSNGISYSARFDRNNIANTSFSTNTDLNNYSVISGNGNTVAIVNVSGELYVAYRDSSAPLDMYKIRLSGSINIQPVQSPLSLSPLNPIQLSPLHPFTPIITPMSVTPSDVTTVNDWMLGGEQWMITTVTLNDGDGIALYYAGLTEPLVFDSSTGFDFNNGTCTFTHNDTGYTFTYTSIYYAQSDSPATSTADYVIMSDSAYIKSDTEILAWFTPSNDSGALADGDTTGMTVTSISDGTASLGSAAVQYSESEYGDTYVLNSVSLTYDTDQTAEPIAVIVTSGTTVVTVVEDKTLQTIVELIPLVLVAAIVIGCVALMVTKRE